jgi:hypothetical protein
MGSFKPMVKMMTTEPSIELKLKKGGHVAMPKMKAKDHGTDHKKMADGGMSGVLSRVGLPPGPVGGAAPAAPSMAMRRKAMMMGRKKMKDGGDTKLEKHASMPASKAHKGLKTGGVAMGQGGYKNGGSVIPVSASKRGAEGYAETMMHTAKPDRSPAKTGDVKMGNAGGYKKGGLAGYAKGGGVEGNVSGTPAGVSNTKTGEVRKGNAGGYKKGGALKKFAKGGSVNDSGKAEKMPQKSPPTPVSINRLSGTYRNGGKVKKYEGGGAVSDNEMSYNKFYEDEEKENRETREQFMRALKDPLGTMKKIPRKFKEALDALGGQGAVSEKEREVTRSVVPSKKRGGGVC